MSDFVVEAADGSGWYENDLDLGIQCLGTYEDMVEGSLADDAEPWVSGDYETFRATLALERELRSYGVPNDAPFEVVDGLQEFVDRWRGALPYDEQERIAILTTETECSAARGARDSWEAGLRVLPDRLQTAEFELMSSGVRKVVHGRDLVRRWWSWRRGLDEFEGQDSYARATEAVGRMTARLLPRDSIFRGTRLPMPITAIMSLSDRD